MPVGATLGRLMSGTSRALMLWCRFRRGRIAKRGPCCAAWWRLMADELPLRIGPLAMAEPRARGGSGTVAVFSFQFFDHGVSRSSRRLPPGSRRARRSKGPCGPSKRANGGSRRCSRNCYRLDAYSGPNVKPVM
jgi:hypothetical protein